MVDGATVVTGAVDPSPGAMVSAVEGPSVASVVVVCGGTVVVVFARVQAPTFTDIAYSGSVASITTERSSVTPVIFPTSPAPLVTVIPTRIPLDLPRFNSNVCVKFDGDCPTTCAVTLSIPAKVGRPLSASNSCASRTLAVAAIAAPSCFTSKSFSAKFSLRMSL